MNPCSKCATPGECGIRGCADRAYEAPAGPEPSIEDLCARIKAADDAAADGDYMLDSNDCISVLRGTWKGPLANDCPPKPAQAERPGISQQARDMSDEDMDAVQTAINELDAGDIGYHAFCDRIIAIASPAPAGQADMTDDDIAQIAERLGAWEPNDSFWRGFAKGVLALAAAPKSLNQQIRESVFFQRPAQEAKSAARGVGSGGAG